MKIAIVNGKGGLGKTPAVVNYALVLTKRPTMLPDLWRRMEERS